ncbi:hypothetical protein Hdeb2414_s0011g00368951 [Helianthus debilis subsp. tardiflorus]
MSLSDKATINQDFNKIIGTNNRIPRLLLGGSFLEWKFRFIQYMKIKYPKAWRSICDGPAVITNVIDDARGTTAIKPESEYNEEDHEKVETDGKALAMLHSALVLEINVGVREAKSVQELWNSLLAMYEGNEEMKESKRDMLTQRFNMFNHFPGETLENQIQRFISLISEMRTHDMPLQNSVVNKKLLNALPRSWDTNVTLIKRTKDLTRMGLV